MNDNFDLSHSIKPKLWISNLAAEKFSAINEGNQQVISKLDHVGSVAKIPKDIVISPQQSVPSTFLVNGGNVDFKIPKLESLCNGLILEVQASNSDDANDVTPACVPLMIDRIEILANSGSTIVQTIYGENLFFDIASLLQQEQFEVQAALMNTTTALGAPGK